jgi:hypothetical protein
MPMAIHQAIARSDESQYDYRLHGLLPVSGATTAIMSANYFGKMTLQCSAG